jgi:hypothetical protein
MGLALPLQVAVCFVQQQCCLGNRNVTIAVWTLLKLSMVLVVRCVRARLAWCCRPQHFWHVVLLCKALCFFVCAGDGQLFKSAFLVLFSLVLCR